MEDQIKQDPDEALDILKKAFKVMGRVRCECRMASAPDIRMIEGETSKFMKEAAEFLYGKDSELAKRFIDCIR